MTKKDGEIAKLKRTIETLESKIKDMQRTSVGIMQDKTGWKGEELIFVKEVTTSAGTGYIPRRSFYGRTGRNICQMIQGACTQCV